MTWIFYFGQPRKCMYIQSVCRGRAAAGFGMAFRPIVRFAHKACKPHCPCASLLRGQYSKKAGEGRLDSFKSNFLFNLSG